MKSKSDVIGAVIIIVTSIFVYAFGLKLDLLGFAIGITLAGIIKSLLDEKVHFGILVTGLIAIMKCLLDYKGIIYISDGLFLFFLGVILIVFQTKGLENKSRIKLYSCLVIVFVIGIFAKNIIDDSRLIEDYSLNKKVKKEIERMDLIYEPDSLLKIERLYIDRYDKVTSIKDIDKLVNLKELAINYKGYYDFSILENLKNLESIMIEHSKLSDLDFINDLKGIKEIEFWDCDFNDYSVFDNIERYEEFSIAKFDIYDISFLSKGKNIKKLHLYDGYIKDTTFFKEMESLEELSIQDISTNNIDFINEIPKLRKVKIYSNNIVEGIDTKKIKEGIELEFIN